MRTQHAHYGCGTALGVAVYPGVPALEMLVVKEWQGEREEERQRSRILEERGGHGKGLTGKSEDDEGVDVD